MTTNRNKGFLGAAAGGALLVLASCVAERQDAADTAVTIRLSNTGPETLRCQLIYGHWVERGLGEIAPGASVQVDLMRAAEDGGLYNMRPDGRKKMMVENVICGRLDGWKESLGQIDLNELRRRAASHVETSCAAPMGAGRVACRMNQISE